MGMDTWTASSYVGQEGRGQNWENHSPTPTGRCPTHPDTPTRQHGVHLLADGACREEKQSYSGSCLHCQGCRLGCAEGSEFSHRKRPKPRTGFCSPYQLGDVCPLFWGYILPLGQTAGKKGQDHLEEEQNTPPSPSRTPHLPLCNALPPACSDNVIFYRNRVPWRYAIWHCTTSALGMTCAQQDPLAYPGQAVFLTAPYPTQAVDKAWPTPCPSACSLTKQLLAVQLLSVEGAGPIEQGMVFRVHRLNLVQCGFSTSDPLAGEIRRSVALKVQLSVKPRPSLCTTAWGTWSHF